MPDQPKTRRRLQFSLRTLLLTVLLGASGVLLWLHWQPWQLERTYTVEKAVPPELSPDGRRVVVRCSDYGILVRDFDSGNEFKLAENMGEVTAVMFSADSRRVIATSHKTSSVFDLDTRACCCTLTAESGWWLSPDGALAAYPAPASIAGEGEGKLRVFDTRDGSQRLELSGSRAVWFLRGSRYIVTEDREHVIRLSDAASGRPLKSITGDAVAVDVSPDDHFFAVAHGIALKIYDLRTDATPQTFFERAIPDSFRSNRISALCFSADSQSLLVHSSDGCSLWDVRNMNRKMALSMEFLPNGKLVLADPWRIYDPATYRDQPIEEFLPLESGEAMPYVPRHSQFAVTHQADDASVWDMVNQSRLGRLTGLLKSCTEQGVELSPSGRYLSVNDKLDGRRWIWSVEHDRGQPLGPPSPPGSTQSDVKLKFSGDERHVVTYWEDGDKIRLYQRRRPETALGFMRLPEFWLLALFAAAWLRNIWRGGANDDATAHR